MYGTKWYQICAQFCKQFQIVLIIETKAVSLAIPILTGVLLVGAEAQQKAVFVISFAVFANASNPSMSMVSSACFAKR